MKKEKWLLKEIDTWQEKEIVTGETADTLRSMYQPKKSINVLIVLFSIIGSLLIGMGIVLVSANNWWYALPIGVRAFIGFMPLVISQLIVFYVYRYKMESTAFRESSALLNVAGVFASIALVGQIFHIPGDFTNYLLTCGLLFLPVMLVMNAVSPVIIYYWTAINGGVYLHEEYGVIISAVMLFVGAVFALKKCKEKSGKSTYLSIITVASALTLVNMASLRYDITCQYGDLVFALILLSFADKIKGSEAVFTLVGKLTFLVMAFIGSFRDSWMYMDDCNVPFAIVLLVCSIAVFVRNILAKKYSMFNMASFVIILLLGICTIFGISDYVIDIIFMIITNLILFAVSVVCIVKGAKNIDLYEANVGMVTLCVLVVMRFFDSALPLSTRGIIFLLLGAGFMVFNLYLVKSKKKIKEETL